MATMAGAGLTALGTVAMPVAAAVAAIGTVAWMTKQAHDKIIDTGKQLASSYTVTSQTVDAFAGEVGKESKSAEQRRHQLEAVTDSQVTQAETSRVSALAAGQAGQAILQKAQNALDLWC